MRRVRSGCKPGSIAARVAVSLENVMHSFGGVAWVSVVCASVLLVGCGGARTPARGPGDLWLVGDDVEVAAARDAGGGVPGEAAGEAAGGVVTSPERRGVRAAPTARGGDAGAARSAAGAGVSERRTVVIGRGRSRGGATVDGGPSSGEFDEHCDDVFDGATWGRDAGASSAAASTSSGAWGSSPGAVWGVATPWGGVPWSWATATPARAPARGATGAAPQVGGDWPKPPSYGPTMLGDHGARR